MGASILFDLSNFKNNKNFQFKLWQSVSQKDERFIESRWWFFRKSRAEKINNIIYGGFITRKWLDAAALILSDFFVWIFIH